MRDLPVKALGVAEFREKLREIDAHLWSAGQRRLGKELPPTIYDVRDETLYVIQYETRP